MKRPIDAYREGYEKGRHDSLGGRLAEVTMGMMRDDPGGYFAAGYHDGAGGKKFNPPAKRETKPGSRSVSRSSSSDLEKQWYRLCNASDFIDAETCNRYIAALRAEGSQAAIAVGLSDFRGHTCLRCGEAGQFKIRFLGRLRHPACEWTGYMGTGAYIAYQIMQIIQGGVLAGVSVKEDVESKRDARGAWILAVFGFLAAVLFRSVLALLLILLHVIAALLQGNQTRSQLLLRLTLLGSLLVAGGIGLYVSNRQSQSSTRFVPPSVAVSSISGRSITPSFDCKKARASVEVLICRDNRLAELESGMASSYRQALSRLSLEAQTALRREHLAWFKQYSRTCNRSVTDSDRAVCVANYLTARTSQLRIRLQQ